MDKQCSNNAVETCQTDGTWGAAVACVNQACVSGGCESVGPSCAGLAATCGPDGNGSCCGANVVTGGTYNRGNDIDYPATVSDFRLDNYEITVGRFRKFAAVYSQTMTANGAGKNPNNPRDPGWDTAWNASLPPSFAVLILRVNCNGTYQTWTDRPSGNESRPMNCIDWYEAYAFCIWDGGRLPTEAEWNYAAAGGSEQRQYPWGATAPDCSYANYRVADYCTLPGTGATSDVGSESPKGDGKWGQSNLAGNVWEWTEDWYSIPGYPKPCDNCSNSTPADLRVVRGGGFDSDASKLPSSSRADFNTPSDRSNFSLGARCARTP